MAKLSVIIPHYPYGDEINNKLDECRSKLENYDELVLVVNQGIGFAKAVNLGFKMAKGDFLLLVSNDVIYTGGDIRDLCDPEAVTCPVVNGRRQEFYGCTFCLPRWVYEKICALRGGKQFLDEQFDIGFFEDDNLIMELRQLNIPMRSVKTVSAVTQGSQTMKIFGSADPYNNNRARFIKKWGVSSSNPIKYED